jgi:hypothetical protein
MRRILAICTIVLFLTPNFASAARVYTNGFEWQSMTAGVEVTAVVLSPTIDTAIKHSGAASMEFAGTLSSGTTGGANYTGGVTGATLYARAYIYVDSIDSSVGADAGAYLAFYTSGGTDIAHALLWNDSGTLTLTGEYNNGGSALGDYTTGLAFDTWHRVEIFYDSSPADGSEVFTIRIDGTTALTSSSVTFTNKTVGRLDWGGYNATGGDISGALYFDDIAVNTTSGSAQTSYPGEGNIVLALPNGDGDNRNCSNASENYVDVQEVPPSDTATAGTTMCQLDNNGDILDVAVTDSSTLGIDSYDTITLVQPMVRIREEASGTSSYNLRVKSAASGTVSASSNADAGSGTARTNPSSTTSFATLLVSYTDPTTTVAWTPTGTNSIDNMQIGVANADADSTPDAWVLTLAAMVEYVDGTAPAAGRRVMRLFEGYRIKFTNGKIILYGL